jgi:DNA topoisomerase-2
MTKPESKTITEFLNKDYTNYAMYVLENRAIASVVDGFKPTQRKIIHIANKIWSSGNGKPLKIFQLGGKVSSEAYYHHGDASMNSSIINLAQRFKNNLPLLEEHGQFGSLRSPEAGAPRYIGTRLSPNFRKLYKDFELLQEQFEEGNKIEPAFFLPILPVILINGSQGIAVGYASKILMRDPKSILRQCMNFLQGKPIRDISPKQNEFDGKFERDKDNPKKWMINGNFERVNTTTIRITEIGIGMTYQKWEDLLEELLNNKKIASYEDNSKDNIDYTIKMQRNQLAEMNDDDIRKMFKLSEYVVEDYVTLDERGKLKIFNSVPEIIEYFMNLRLEYYGLRKKYLIDKISSELFVLKNKAMFIKSIIDEKLVVNKRKRVVIEKDLAKLKIEPYNDSYSYLLGMGIQSLTAEKYAELIQQLKSKKEELSVIKKTKPAEMYISDLTELEKQL